MAKALDIINRALRLGNAISSGEAAEAAESADALSVLKNLFAEWYGNIAIPEYTVTSLTADMTIDAGDVEALAYQLWLRLAPEYGQSVSQEFLTIASESMTRLRNRYFVSGTVNFDELPVPSNGSMTFDNG